MRYFDYEKTAREAKIPADTMAALSRIVRDEFPKDDVMYELHLLRVCMAIQQGLVSFEEAIKPEAVSNV